MLRRTRSWVPKRIETAAAGCFSPTPMETSLASSMAYSHRRVHTDHSMNIDEQRRDHRVSFHRATVPQHLQAVQHSPFYRKTQLSFEQHNQLHHRLRIVRSLSYYKEKALRKRQKEGECPFVVLGLREKSVSFQKPSSPFGNLHNNNNPNDIPFSKVKQTFLKIAMAHHPDTSSAESEADQEEDKRIFLAALAAFEKIAPNPDGMAVLKTELDGYKENDEQDLGAWFKQETGGFDMPFMDPQTIKEVTKTMEEIGGGLDRDGGMWQLARMVSDKANSGSGDAGTILALEAGVVKDRRGINGVLRRKRNR